MATRKKKTARRPVARRASKKASAPKKKWWRLGNGSLARTLVSEQLVQRVPVDLLRAEVTRHFKKKHPVAGFLVTETHYANVPFFIATFFDEYHTAAYQLMKQRKDPRADQMLPETTVDLGTFHQGLLNAL